MRAVIGFAINTYRKTPLYPLLGQVFATMLVTPTRWFKGSMFVHDTRMFKMNIDLEQRIDAKVYYTGTWEPDTVATIDKLLPVDAVGIDVGANIGFLTLYMATRVKTQGRVIAFEPVSWTFQRLKANIELNDMPQITLNQMGLSDKNEVCPEADIPYGYRLDGKIVTLRESVEMITLDAYLRDDPVSRLDFIKCDTDGNEERMFLGARETLEKFHPALHFELYQEQSRENADSSERLLKYLDKLGYRFYREGTLEPFNDLEDVINTLKPMKQCVNVVALA